MSLRIESNNMDILDEFNNHAEKCNLDMRLWIARNTKDGMEFCSDVSSDCSLVCGSKMDYLNFTYRRRLCSADDIVTVVEALDVFLVEEFGLGGWGGLRQENT